MKIRKIKTLCAAVGLAVGAMTATSANAITFTGTPYIGSIDVDIVGYDSGTVGYPLTGFNPVGPLSQNGVSCTSVATCDAAPPAFPAPNGIGSEDTWGVLRINAIRDLALNNIWTASATEQLYGMFYGFADKQVNWSTINGGLSFSFDTWSSGGTIKIWEHGAVISDFADVLAAPGGNGPANRTGPDGYLGNSTTQLNNGNLWLQLTAAPGQVEYPGTTLESHFSSTSASGGSGVYADVTGGSAASLFVQTLTDERGVLRDIFIDNTNNAGVNLAGSWTVRANGAGSGSVAIPEPGSMALVGLGLLGLAGLRRRKQA